jgi:hypothetical protein
MMRMCTKLAGVKPTQDCKLTYGLAAQGFTALSSNVHRTVLHLNGTDQMN